MYSGLWAAPPGDMAPASEAHVVGAPGLTVAVMWWPHCGHVVVVVVPKMVAVVRPQPATALDNEKD